MQLAEDNSKLTTQVKENGREVSQGQCPEGLRGVLICTSFPLSSNNISTSSKYFKSNCRIRIIHALSFLKAIFMKYVVAKHMHRGFQFIQFEVVHIGKDCRFQRLTKKKKKKQTAWMKAYLVLSFSSFHLKCWVNEDSLKMWLWNSSIYKAPEWLLISRLKKWNLLLWNIVLVNIFQ